jgi:hypothetical protein
MWTGIVNMADQLSLIAFIVQNASESTFLEMTMLETKNLNPATLRNAEPHRFTTTKSLTHLVNE